MEHNYCVFIGRFQPFHNAHLQVIQQALHEARELIVIVGSARAARNVKNPWTYEERVAMISACLSPEERKRVHFVPVRDYFYSENVWVTQIQQAVNAITGGDSNVALIGSYKDSSSYYIKYFPQWEFIPAKNDKMLNATDVRSSLFTTGEQWREVTPSSVTRWLDDNFLHTDHYVELKEEHAFIEDYKAKSKFVGHSWPATFTTVDAVVIQSGHVLVVRRKFNPGKGLLALPGGFIKQNESLEQAAIRELKEETGIKVPNAILSSSIVDSHVFDHPGRSLRGRTITHAFCVRLASGELPEVKGSDDAAKAFWLPLMDIARLEDQFYEDHAHIIQRFVSKF